MTGGWSFLPALDARGPNTVRSLIDIRSEALVGTRLGLRLLPAHLMLPGV